MTVTSKHLGMDFIRILDPANPNEYLASSVEYAKGGLTVPFGTLCYLCTQPTLLSNCFQTYKERFRKTVLVENNDNP